MTTISRLASVALFGRVAGRGFHYALTIVVARAVSPEALGTLTFGLVLLRIGGAASRAGMDTAAMKFVPEHVDQGTVVTGVVVVCLGTPLLVGSALVLGGQTAMEFVSLGTSREETVVAVLVLGIPLFGFFRVGEATTRAFKYTRYAVYIRDFGQAGSAVMLAIVAVVVFDSIVAVAVGYVVSLLLAGILAVVFLVRLGAFSDISSANLPVRRIFRFGVPVAVVSILNFFIMWTDVLMLSWLEGYSHVGVYEVAYQTAMLLTFALVAVNAIFPPIASELYAADAMSSLQDVYGAVTKWITLFTLFGIGFVLLFPDHVLVVFGTEYSAARNPLMILAVSQLFVTAVGPAGFLLSMTNNERVEMVNTIAVAATNVGLNFVLIQQYGVVGAAVATGASMAVLNVVRVGEIRYLLGIRPPFAKIPAGFVALGSALGGALVLERLLFDSGNLSFLVFGGGFALGVFVVVALLCCFDADDKLLLATIDR